VAVDSFGNVYVADSRNDRIQKFAPIFSLEPPEVPGLYIVSVSRDKIDLSWNDLSNETTYTLFRNTENNTNTATGIAGFPANQTNYSDTTLTPYTTYHYWLKAYNQVGASRFSEPASATTKSRFPQVFAVFPTYFNPEKDGKAKIYFAGETHEVDVKIYDISGNIVITFDRTSGEEYVEWDGRDDKKDELNAGIYIVHIKGKNVDEKIKMIIIR